ncbi:DUF2461 domain-containing protein [Subsaximicrobium wynnwilliamsii]|uniref:DUF2461 domain-containing protein n=1 Tax=Subsaximicrobium wynnwilliamsii TaxID=291179 RepID=A0A5C6ZMK2_9FLAO|nr:DUF2461 domain-containing protein [Subsaximicrobium wynnwilliamsii]TXD90163.1 DUF2461 domain-containing protein [Subsaximicrobium wynnwilliamsii]
MLQDKTLAFLTKLKKNNTTEWFKDNQNNYKKSRADFENFVSDIINGLASIDSDIEKQDLQAKKCIKRINRDIRFSNDKSPYKTNYFANFNPNGRKSEHASYYLHLEPNNCFVGGGVYMPQTPTLNKFRKEIEHDLKEWESLLNSKSFKETFPNGIESPSELKTAPKGFDKESPAIEYLRKKGFYTMRKLTDKEITSENAVSKIIEHFGEVKPVIGFLNRAL